MKTRIFSIILSAALFSQISFAQICAKLVAVSCGEFHTLALDENGNLYSCGGDSSTSYYPLGLGNISANVLYLRQVKGPNGAGNLKHIISFDAGWEHSLAVDSNHLCWAWGIDSYGKLGNGSGGNSSVPILVHGLNDNSNGLQNIVTVSAGRSGQHSLAVDSSGYVYAWGFNYYGQCGDGNAVPGNNWQYPILVVDSSHTQGRHLGDEAFIVDVDAGVHHSLALVRFQDGGFVYEWGGNNNSSIPKKVLNSSGTGPLRKIIDIATCSYSLAADSNGDVWFWTTSTAGNPTKISNLPRIVKVAAGRDHDDLNHYAALDVNGNVWEWMQGDTPAKVLCGQMPTASGYLEDINAFDVGYYNHRVAIDKYGCGWAWGGNNYGELGVGDYNSRTQPTRMVYIPEPNVWNITKNPHTHYTTIGAAIDDADSGYVNEIVVYPGIYNEEVNFGSKQIHLRSSDPNNPFIVNNTVILGYGDSIGVVVSSSDDSTIDGLTITHCENGIDCYYSNLTVNRCRIENLITNYWGLSCQNNPSNTLIVNRCRIENNSNGITCNDGTLEVNETFVNNNSGTFGGIYMYQGKAVITDSIIHHNTKGISLDQCSSSSKLWNNTIVSNGNYGIYRNAGAADPCVYNNIIYYNSSGSLGFSSGSSFNNVHYNCLSSVIGYPADNISSDPCFVNKAGNDFHLRSNSPCIDKGDSNLISPPNKADIDGEARAKDGDFNGTVRVDIGADEFKLVDFISFSIFANAWRTDPNNQKWNAVCDFVADNKIDTKDLAVFAAHWLQPTDWINGSKGTYFTDNSSSESMLPEDDSSLMQSESPQQSQSDSTGSSLAESQSPSESEGSQQQSEQQYLPDYNLPAIYLTCDNNAPQPNDEVTIQVHSVAPLFAMGLGIYISGDANITTAMSEADCNSFGWDNGWNSDPYIDPNGWAYLNGVKWDADVNGVVGYVKFRYHSGQVSVYIDQENSLAFEWNGDSCPIVPLSQEVLLIARDPNEP
jgi:alpha-tubulin suppressor-like RCC1 family protein